MNIVRDEIILCVKSRAEILKLIKNEVTCGFYKINIKSVKDYLMNKALEDKNLIL